MKNIKNIANFQLIIKSILIFCTLFICKSSFSFSFFPNRVEVPSNQKAAYLTIINPESDSAYFKVEMIIKRMDEAGNLIEVKPEEYTEIEKKTEGMIKISPRKFSISPRSSQAIRIIVRKQSDLVDGDYVARLVMTKLATPEGDVSVDASDAIKSEEQKKENLEKAAKDLQGAKNKRELGVKFAVNFAQSIPIIVSIGDVKATAEIIDPKLSLKKDKDNKYLLNFEITRSGNKSVYGDIEITHVNKAGKSTIVKVANGLAIYNPNPKRIFNLSLDVQKGHVISPGDKIIIAYKNRKTSVNEMGVYDNTLDQKPATDIARKEFIVS